MMIAGSNGDTKSTEPSGADAAAGIVKDVTRGVQFVSSIYAQRAARRRQAAWEAGESLRQKYGMMEPVNQKPTKTNWILPVLAGVGAILLIAIVLKRRK